MADNIEERRARYVKQKQLLESGVILCYYCREPAKDWKPGFPEDGDQHLPLCGDCVEEVVEHSRRRIDEIATYGEPVTIREARQEDADRKRDIDRLRAEIGDGLHPGWQILPNGASGIVVYDWPGQP